MTEPITIVENKPERAVLIGVVKKGETRRHVADTLAELALLTDTAGGVVRLLPSTFRHRQLGAL